jgi:hypothetical protein
MTAGAFSLSKTQEQALDYTSFNYETSLHRPDSYGISTGNFDASGGSFGVIQFNWKSGTCQPIFQDMILTWTDDLVASITNTTDYNTFVDVVQNRTTADQIAWGDTITNQTNKHLVIEPWNTYFKTLGTKESYQNRQDMACNIYFQNANTWCSDFGLWTRRGYSLAFDISVQYGGISTAAHTDIMNFVAALPNTLTDELKELRKMRYIAWRTAQDHTGTYYASSLARKMGIANGQGIVYGGLVKTYDYDLLLEGNGLVGLPAKKKPRWQGI